MQREPHAGEDTALLDAAGLADERGGAGHVLGVRGIAGDPEPDVRLDGRGEIAGAAEVGRPRAVGALLAADPLRGRRDRARVEQPEEVAQEDVLGVDRHVGLELALPPALIALEREQAARCSPESALVGVDRAVGSDGHAARSPARAARAAARPLRTALSIVAGQPVSVHAPARYTP